MTRRTNENYKLTPYQELTEEVEDTPEERLSIMSYQISFLTMQFHSILLKRSSTAAGSRDQVVPDNTDAQQHRRTLDDWLVCWKKHLEAISESGRPNPLLLALGEFHYYHGLYILSKACPTLGVGLVGVCDKMARSCTTVARCQQVLPTAASRGKSPGFIYPVSWAMSHAVFQAALCMLSIREDSYQNGERSVAIRRCLTSLSLLEADPDNLSTGLTAMLEALCG